MSLSFLPRGVAAKRGTLSSPQNDKGDDMQLDPPTSLPLSSLREPRVKEKDETTSLLDATTSQSLKDGNRRKPPKSLDPRYLAVLIETSMSDYALWANKDLRRFATDRRTKGYFALSKLFNASPLIQATGLTTSETAVLQALKDHGTGVLELQLKLSNPGRNGQMAMSNSVYNVRRADWDTLTGTKPTASKNPATVWDRSMDEWNERTIYIENIPRKYWSLPAALYFSHATLSSPLMTPQKKNEPNMETEAVSCIAEASVVQWFELPAHAKASEGDTPTCRGFAFVTCSTVEGAQSYLRQWPWTKLDGVASVADGETRMLDEDASDVEEQLEGMMTLNLGRERDERDEIINEASRSGLRCMSFLRWEELKSEYLERQATLYEATRAANRSTSHTHGRGQPRPASPILPPSTATITRARDQPPHMSSRQEDSISSKRNVDYPEGCLLFVKNLHPQTNKTALKTLFGDILKLSLREMDGGIDQRGEWQEVDYVDWSKGMSSCHIRLSHPIQAQHIVRYLSHNPRIQNNGSDTWDRLLQPSSSDMRELGRDDPRPLVAELVEGRAESIYWEKVPEKIKKGATARLDRLERDLDSREHGATAADRIVLDSQVGTSEATTGDEGSKPEEREKKRRRRA